MEKRQNSLTVSICTCNRADKLKSTVSLLIKQMNRNHLFPRLLIVDSSKDGKTKQVVESFKRKHGKAISITYVYEPGNGISFARNKAVESTKTTYLCFIDDDIIPHKTWLPTLYEFLKDNSEAVITYGPIYPISESGSKLSKFLDEIFHFTPWILTSNITNNENLFPYIANAMFEMKLFKKIGRFNTVFSNRDKKHFHPYGEDPEFFQRTEENGFSSCYLKGMAVDHKIDLVRSDLLYLARRYYDDGKNKILYRFYSKNYVHSPFRFLTGNILLAREIFTFPTNNIILRSVYVLSELAGHLVMSWALLRNYSYYNSQKRN